MISKAYNNTTELQNYYPFEGHSMTYFSA